VKVSIPVVKRSDSETRDFAVEVDKEEEAVTFYLDGEVLFDAFVEEVKQLAETLLSLMEGE